MNLFLKRGLLFLVLFFILEKSSYCILKYASNKEYDKRLNSVLEGEVNKDIVVLGSSRGAGNILAGQIEKQTGFSTYNLSYLGSNILFHKFILKQLIDNNMPPKQLLYVIDNPSHFIEVPSLLFRYDRLYPLVNYNVVNNKLIEDNKHSWLSKIFILGRLHKLHFKLKAIKKPKYNPIDAYGSMPFIKQNTNIDLKVNDNNTATTKEVINEPDKQEYILALKEIEELCRKNTIKLAFVFSPDYGPFNTNFVNRFTNLVNKDHSVFVYNIKNPVYKDSNNFYDISHLNKGGASIFTSEISDFIINNYNK